MEKAGYGSDLPSVQIELESHFKEHKTVEKFQSNVDKCISNKVKTVWRHWRMWRIIPIIFNFFFLFFVFVFFVYFGFHCRSGRVNSKARSRPSTPITWLFCKNRTTSSWRWLARDVWPIWNYAARFYPISHDRIDLAQREGGNWNISRLVLEVAQRHWNWTLLRGNFVLPTSSLKNFDVDCCFSRTGAHNSLANNFEGELGGFCGLTTWSVLGMEIYAVWSVANRFLAPILETKQIWAKWIVFHAGTKIIKIKNLRLKAPKISPINIFPLGFYDGSPSGLSRKAWHPSLIIAMPKGGIQFYLLFDSFFFRSTLFIRFAVRSSTFFGTANKKLMDWVGNNAIDVVLALGWLMWGSQFVTFSPS